MRVLVTGGAGFIGSHLCRALVDAGHEVTCLDDFSTGSAANLEPLPRYPAFSLVRADVQAPITGEFERIYHLACPASPVQYRKNPVRTIQVALIGTLRALEAAQRCGARVLLASTSEVYGDPLVHPQPEDYRGNVDTQGPRACYDEGKRAGETLAADFHRERGVDVRIARIFNTYGPRMALDDGRVVSNFMVAALRGLPLTLTGGGGQSRSFCHVGDMLRGLTALMEYTGPGATAPVNLGNPQEVTVAELARLVLRLSGSGSALQPVSAEAGDPARRCPDISRARAMFGFAPTVTLEDGLARTLDDFRARLQASSR